MIWMPHRFPEHWTLINSDRMKEFEVPFSAKNTPSEEELKKKASVAMGAPVGQVYTPDMKTHAIYEEIYSKYVALGNFVAKK